MRARESHWLIRGREGPPQRRLEMDVEKLEAEGGPTHRSSPWMTQGNARSRVSISTLARRAPDVANTILSHVGGALRKMRATHVVEGERTQFGQAGLVAKVKVAP